MRQKKSTGLFQITRKLILMLTIVSIGLSIKAQINGAVVDGSNVPMPGVNVIVKGTTVGTVTDINGKFSIKATENDVLTFSFVGYQSQEIKVGTNTTINVTLSEEKKELDEVVVIGYGVQKKSDLTGAVTSVSAKDLSLSPVSSVDQALQGHAAGVQISSNSGAPGADVTVRVRGNASINNLPVLWVVDGVPADPKTVNPNDIESMEVLKDASTAAIYGASGASGVILITTKKGQAGKVDVDFNYYSGWQNIPQYYDVANGRQYASMMNEIRATKNMSLSAKLQKPMPFSNLDTVPNYNYQKLITTANAPMQSVDLGVAGGSEKTKAYGGIGYVNQEGIVKATNFKKLTFRLNAENKAQKWLTIGEEASFTYQQYDGFPFWKLTNQYWSPLLAAAQYQPNVAPYDLNQHPAAGLATPKGGGNWSNEPFGNIQNPVSSIELEQGNEINKNYNGGITGHITIEPVKGLTFQSRLNGSFSFNNYGDFVPAYLITPTLKNNPSSYTENWTITNGWLWQNIATYNHTFFEDHNISLMGGYESKFYRYNESINTGVTGISSSPDMRYLGTSNNAASMLTYPTGTAQVATSYGEFGRISYDYKGKYLFQFNIRYDGSSNFGPNMRFGTFPSFSGGWKFSEEDFVKNLNIFSFGKLRVGYGSVGNSAINPYSYYQNVAALSTAAYDFGGTTTQSNGAMVPSLANPSVHWESIVTQDLGLDLAFLQNRLSVNLDLFQRFNNGMLMQNPIKGYDGYVIRDKFNENANIDPTPYVNIGKLKNTGVEITASWKDQLGEFKYGVDANITFVSSKAVSLPYDSVFDANASISGINGYISYTRVGQPVGEFYGYKVDRVFTSKDVDTTGNPKGYATNQPYTLDATGKKVYAQASAKPGDFKWKDLNGDGKINYKDIAPLGDPLPKFLYSFNMSFEYKFLDLQLFWQGTYGNKIFNGVKFFTSNPDGSWNFSSAYVNNHYRDNITDLNGTILYPRRDGNYPGVTQSGSTSTISDFYVEDGSYLRLKNIQLGVTLPKNWLNWMNVSTFRVYVGARNLLTFTKYSGIDPEIDVSTPTAAGIDKGTYPQAKLYTLGVNVRF